MFDNEPKKCPYCLTRVPVGVIVCPGCRREMPNLWKRRHSAEAAEPAAETGPTTEESDRVLSLYYRLTTYDRLKALALLREMAGDPAAA